MRPTLAKNGQRLVYDRGGGRRVCYFVKRVPSQNGRPAENYVRFPDFAGLNGNDDDGTCRVSDYEFSKFYRSEE